MTRKTNLPREAALAAGHSFYTAAKPCKNGHAPIRSAKSNVCKECDRLSSFKRNRSPHGKAMIRKWKDDNIEQFREKDMLYQRKRRKKAEGRFHKPWIKAALAEQDNKCAGCDGDISENHQVDHIMPIALGGKSTKDNLQMLCPSCNQDKRDKHPDDWQKPKHKPPLLRNNPDI